MGSSLAPILGQAGSRSRSGRMYRTIGIAGREPVSRVASGLRCAHGAFLFKIWEDWRGYLLNHRAATMREYLSLRRRRVYMR